MTTQSKAVALFFISTLLTVCTSSAAANCVVVDLVAEAAYKAATDAAKRSDMPSARASARLFWEIRNVTSCPLGKEYGRLLTGVKLSASDVGSLECATVEVSGQAQFRQLPGGNIQFRKQLAPEEIQVNGIRYRVIADATDKLKFSVNDVQGLLADKEKLQKFSIDKDNLQKWKATLP